MIQVQSNPKTETFFTKLQQDFYIVPISKPTELKRKMIYRRIILKRTLFLFFRGGVSPTSSSGAG